MLGGNVQVREDVKRACIPQFLLLPERLPPLPSWEETIKQLTGPPVPRQAPLSSAAAHPAALRIIWQRYCCQAEAHAAPGSRPSAADASEAQAGHRKQAEGDAVRGVRNKESLRSSGRDHDRACRDSEVVAEKGVFYRPRKRARGLTWQVRHDAAFLMGLQQGGSEASGSSDDSLADGSATISPQCHGSSLS